MNFTQAIKNVFSKYATFEGRARRAEYWYYALFLTIVNVALQIVAVMGENPPNGAIWILVLFMLATSIPSLAVSARRLHDIDRSGWWILISCVPLIGLILLVWVCTRGTLGTNRFGEDPLA